MDKIILSEQALYHGDVNMPKGFEIDREKFQEDILISQLENSEIPYSRNFDMLSTFLIDHINCDYKIQLAVDKIKGNTYKPDEVSTPLLNVDPVDLKSSPDFTCLYGVKVDKCMVKIHYYSNRRAGRSWDIELTGNKFIMFPSTCMYYLTNKQKDSLNFVLTTSYAYTEF